LVFAKDKATQYVILAIGNYQVAWTDGYYSRYIVYRGSGL